MMFTIKPETETPWADSSQTHTPPVLLKILTHSGSGTLTNHPLPSEYAPDEGEEEESKKSHPSNSSNII